MTGFENLNEIAASFSWFQFYVRELRLIENNPRVIIEKTDQGTSISLLPHTLQLDIVQKAHHFSDDDLRSLMHVLIDLDFDSFKNDDAPILIDASSREVLAQFGLSRTLPDREWMDFLDMLFSKVKIQQWDEEIYPDPGIIVVDGSEWFISYKIGNDTRRLYGSNAYPRGWKAFISHLRKLTSFSKLKI